MKAGKTAKPRKHPVTANGLHPRVEAEIVRRINTPHTPVRLSLAQLRRELGQ